MKKFRLKKDQKYRIAQIGDAAILILFPPKEPDESGWYREFVLEKNKDLNLEQKFDPQIDQSLYLWGPRAGLRKMKHDRLEVSSFIELIIDNVFLKKEIKIEHFSPDWILDDFSHVIHEITWVTISDSRHPKNEKVNAYRLKDFQKEEIKKRIFGY